MSLRDPKNLIEHLITFASKDSAKTHKLERFITKKPLTRLPIALETSIRLNWPKLSKLARTLIITEQDPGLDIRLFRTLIDSHIEYRDLTIFVCRRVMLTCADLRELKEKHIPQGNLELLYASAALNFDRNNSIEGRGHIRDAIDFWHTAELINEPELQYIVIILCIRIAQSYLRDGHPDLARKELTKIAIQIQALSRRDQKLKLLVMQDYLYVATGIYHKLGYNGKALLAMSRQHNYQVLDQQAEESGITLGSANHTLRYCQELLAANQLNKAKQLTTEFLNQLPTIELQDPTEARKLNALSNSILGQVAQRTGRQEEAQLHFLRSMTSDLRSVLHEQKQVGLEFNHIRLALVRSLLDSNQSRSRKRALSQLRGQPGLEALDEPELRLLKLQRISLGIRLAEQLQLRYSERRLRRCGVKCLWNLSRLTNIDEPEIHFATLETYATATKNRLWAIPTIITLWKPLRTLNDCDRSSWSKSAIKSLAQIYLGTARLFHLLPLNTPSLLLLYKAERHAARLLTRTEINIKPLLFEIDQSISATLYRLRLKSKAIAHGQKRLPLWRRNYGDLQANGATPIAEYLQHIHACHAELGDVENAFSYIDQAFPFRLKALGNGEPNAENELLIASLNYVTQSLFTHRFAIVSPIVRLTQTAIREYATTPTKDTYDQLKLLSYLKITADFLNSPSNHSITRKGPLPPGSIIPPTIQQKTIALLNRAFESHTNLTEQELTNIIRTTIPATHTENELDAIAATIRLRQGKIRDATMLFKKAIRKRPPLQNETFISYATTLLHQGQIRKSLKVLKRAKPSSTTKIVHEAVNKTIAYSAQRLSLPGKLKLALTGRISPRLVPHTQVPRGVFAKEPEPPTKNRKT